MVVKYPFEQITGFEGFIRTFSGTVNEEELVWHRDREDRKVTVIQSDGWYLQMDDELPIPMQPGDVFHIPREKWHRVIRRCNEELIVEIKTS